MFAGSIKLERVLRIQKDRVGIQSYFNDLEECSGAKKETTSRMNLGGTTYRIPEEGRDKK